MNVESIYKQAEEIVSGRVNDMTKIKVKCWVNYSESRIRNNNEPRTFQEFDKSIAGKGFYRLYIEEGHIDCADLGGKEKAIAIVEKWFG